MPAATCHSGSVRITVPGEPAYLVDCNAHNFAPGFAQDVRVRRFDGDPVGPTWTDAIGAASATSARPTP